VPDSPAIEPSSYSAVLRRSFSRTFAPAVRGEGVYLWDARGQRYLDFSGSAAVNFIGHGVAEIAAAMAAQAVITAEQIDWAAEQLREAIEDAVP